MTLSLGPNESRLPTRPPASHSHITFYNFRLLPSTILTCEVRMGKNGLKMHKKKCSFFLGITTFTYLFSQKKKKKSIKSRTLRIRYLVVDSFVSRLMCVLNINLFPSLTALLARKISTSRLLVLNCWQNQINIATH